MRIHASHIAGISVYISSSLCVLINILTHTPPWSVIVVESAFTLRSVLFKHSFPENNFYSKLFSAYKNVCILLLSIGIIYSVYSIIFTVIPIICGIWLLIQSFFLIVLRKKNKLRAVLPDSHLLALYNRFSSKHHIFRLHKSGDGYRPDLHPVGPINSISFLEKTFYRRIKHDNFIEIGLK